MQGLVLWRFPGAGLIHQIVFHGRDNPYPLDIGGIAVPVFYGELSLIVWTLEI